jgi:hypothetical protein
VAPWGTNEAYLCKETGKIYCQFGNSAEFNDELPDDIDDEEKYIPIPDKRELDLGKPLVFEVTGQFLPADFDKVRRIFSRRGAYGNFKDLLSEKGMLDRWHEFSSKAEEKALREWCSENSIELVD